MFSSLPPLPCESYCVTSCSCRLSPAPAVLGHSSWARHEIELCPRANPAPHGGGRQRSSPCPHPTSHDVLTNLPARRCPCFGMSPVPVLSVFGHHLTLVLESQAGSSSVTSSIINIRNIKNAFKMGAGDRGGWGFEALMPRQQARACQPVCSRILLSCRL